MKEIRGMRLSPSRILRETRARSMFDYLRLIASERYDRRMYLRLRTTAISQFAESILQVSLTWRVDIGTI